MNQSDDLMPHILFFMLAFLFSAVPSAWAADDAVGVRGAAHEEYSRLVFDWPQSVRYKLSEVEKGHLSLTFNDQAASYEALAASLEKLGTLRNVTELKPLKSAAKDAVIEILIPAESRYRSFRVGNKVVLDVYNPPGVEKAVVPEQKPEEKKTAAAPKSEDMPVVVKPETPEKIIEEALPAAKPRPKLLEQAEDVSPDVITLSVTEQVGLAAFIRGSDLWVVMDRADILVPPQVAGPHKDLYPSFQRYDLTEGTAFRTRMPASAGESFIYGEGGGLVWRLLVSKKHKEDMKPTEPDVSFARGKDVRGGMIDWPMSAATRVLEIYDPDVQDRIQVVTVDRADQFSGMKRSYVDFDSLYAPIGLAIAPKADELSVALTENKVEIRMPQGLALSREADVRKHEIRVGFDKDKASTTDISKASQKPGDMVRIYDFDRWMLGGIQSLTQNEHVLLATINNKDKNGQVQDLITLAKMNMANDRGPEALGYLHLAESMLPQLAQSPEYLALRGASYALAGQYELALHDLNHSALKQYGELDYWRAYVLAWLEDWQQAAGVMPDNVNLLILYPRNILEKLGVKLAELALRKGNVAQAERILSILIKDKDALNEWTMAAINYLKGEAHRQSSEYELAKQLWEPLSKGHDDFFRARSGLALTMLQQKLGEIETEEAIDRLEGLRYAWRGDEIEAQINFMLGKLYLENRQYLKGFAILRDSPMISPNSDIDREITAYMKKFFRDLFLEHGDELTPIESISVYEEFRELTPSGEEGKELVRLLAERLVEADLLDRAAALLKHQVEYRLDGEDKAKTAIRLAAIELLDHKPLEATKALKISHAWYGQDPQNPANEEKLYQTDLLMARALSEMGRTEDALKLLGKFDLNPEINRLRADIAWRANLWEDAADALRDMIMDEALDLSRPLTVEQADMILNRAVALNLAGDRVELANMRKRYGEAMRKTSRARMFEVVTRSRTGSLLADRTTLEELVNEVDIFKGFLDSYKEASDTMTGPTQ